MRFIGFNNMEEKELDELFLSKGEERRKEQESRGEGGIRFILHQLCDFNMFVKTRFHVWKNGILEFTNLYFSGL